MAAIEFRYFFIYKIAQILPTKFRVDWPTVQKKKRKIYFQEGGHGGHLRFPIGIILVTFDLQVNPILPTKFRVNWFEGVGWVVF